MQLDAFTRTPLAGNACAVVLDADPLTGEQMQAIAREQNLSETAFVLDSEVADVRARYFTPAEEIPLAGHPTIATIYAFASTGRLRLSGSVTTISLELKAGVIPVDIHAENGVPDCITMTQLKPRFLTIISPETAATVFGLTCTDLLADAPVQVVSTGTPQLMIPVRSRGTLRRVQVDAVALTRLRAEADFFSVHLFTVDEEGTYARHFASPPDVFEDPFTGSATGSMGAYLWRYHLIDQPSFRARQGDWMRRPGVAEVAVQGTRTDIESVQVTGSAVTVIRGSLNI